MNQPTAVDRGRRRVGRSARPARSTADYTHLVNPFEPARVMSDDQVAHLHEAALGVLQDSGVKVLLGEARQRFAAAGAKVDDDQQVVRLGRDMVLDAIASAPAEFDLVARNPERSLRVGGRNMMLLPVAGPPFVSDLQRGRRNGTMDDFDVFARLVQRTDVLHGMAPSIEAQDVDLRVRHLATTRSTLVLTDKVPYGYARGRGIVADCLEMVRLANGVDHDTFRSHPYVWTNINTNSPRQIDIPMCMGIIDFAAAGQAAIMTPFTLSGAMAPVSLAGALVLQHAEALAAMTLAQIVRRGAPVVYGAFTSNVDMRSGAPAFGTPETARAAIASGQLARYIGVPWRSQAASTSNVEDAQAGYETMVSMTAALMGGANVVVHAAGWQEGGLTASLEKFVLDVEMLQIVAETFRPLDTSEPELALGSIADVAPGGHFFGTEHTLQRFDTAFYEPTVFTRENFGQWTEHGAVTSAQRASGTWRRWVDEYQQPAIEPDRLAALDDFVARRIAQGGASLDG
ncbi:MAG: trimethylamine methyltransferase family protein [Actinomycetota bacterium]